VPSASETAGGGEGWSFGSSGRAGRDDKQRQVRMRLNENFKLGY
jgi:hypothetical protein